MNTRRRFTLIEVLAACGIIALLAGIGFAGYRYAQDTARENATKSIIHQLATALETCYNKYGFYPSTSTKTDGDDEPKSAICEIRFTFTKGKLTKVEFVKDTKKITTLEKPESDAEKKTTAGKYFTLLANTLDLESIRNSSSPDGSGNTITHTLIDSWGNKIYYCYPGKINTTKFDLVSAGVDGVFGDSGEDTPETLTKTNYIDGKDWICDDIANF